MDAADWPRRHRIRGIVKHGAPSKRRAIDDNRIVQRGFAPTTVDAIHGARHEVIIMNWYFKALGKYASFEGRARRKEYWIFGLVNAAILVALFAAITATASAGHSPVILSIIYGVFALLILLPSIAVMVRRLHDTDRSGWWFWISLIPGVGGIVLLVFTLLDSSPGNNQYGPSPKSSMM